MAREGQFLKYPTVTSDFSALEGTDCYCSEDAAGIIRHSIEALPLKAVHLLGTGDYHYISLFWLERMKESFTLYLFDNHPDNQPGAFGENLLSCGSWVLKAAALPLCRKVVWIRDEADFTTEGGCAYISVDLDVLSEEFAATNWNQGNLTLQSLAEMIRNINAACRVAGMDICGGLKDNPEVNRDVMDIIAGIINK